MKTTFYKTFTGSTLNLTAWCILVNVLIHHAYDEWLIRMAVIIIQEMFQVHLLCIHLCPNTHVALWGFCHYQCHCWWQLSSDLLETNPIQSKVKLISCTKNNFINIDINIYRYRYYKLVWLSQETTTRPMRHSSSHWESSCCPSYFMTLSSQVFSRWVDTLETREEKMIQETKQDIENKYLHTQADGINKGQRKIMREMNCAGRKDMCLHRQRKKRNRGSYRWRHDFSPLEIFLSQLIPLNSSISRLLVCVFAWGKSHQ